MNKTKYIYNIGEVIKTKTGKIIILEQIRVKNGKGTRKGYLYKCLIDGNIDEISEGALKNHNSGCSVCHGKKVLKGYNDIATTHPHLVKYFANIEDAYKYTSGSNEKVLTKCPECGNEKYKIIYNLCNKDFLCPRCSDGLSYPNKFMYNILEYLKIDFISEYSPDWIGLKRYDFYIPSMNLIIEMDGGLGHGNDMHSRDTTTKRESILMDNYKDKLANEHGIEVIRIDCNYNSVEYRFEHIRKNVLNSKLNKILNLSLIEWVSIKENSLNNLSKIACKLKRNYASLTTTEIGKAIGIDRHTILRYLKQGNELGWCIYDSKVEHNRSGFGIKPVAVFKNEVLLGLFESINELSRKSTLLFETEFHRIHISKSCKSKNMYKGYQFKYISDLTSEEYIKYKIN